MNYFRQQRSRQSIGGLVETEVTTEIEGLFIVKILSRIGENRKAY
jgi:hypothetical protein